MKPVTTFGKWEAERKVLVQALLDDDAVPADEASINKALFGQVNEAMFLSGMAAARASSDKANPKDMKTLALIAYDASLKPVLETLSKTLEIDSQRLSKHVQSFVAMAAEKVEHIIDDMVLIGKQSIQSKGAALSQLYGGDFAKRYPDLSKSLLMQDAELVSVGQMAVNAFIKSHDFGQNTEVVNEQLKYINEIAPEVNATEEFQALFDATTGKTMADYKDRVAQQKKQSAPVGRGSKWQPAVKKVPYEKDVEHASIRGVKQ